MKVKRMVDGMEMEFELTEQEMTDAFYEQQHKWDMEYMLNMADMCEHDDWYKKMKSDPDFASMVAHRFRKYISDYPDGDTEYDCFADAYQYVEKWDATQQK